MLLFFSVALNSQNNYKARLTYSVGMKLHREDSALTKEQKKYNLFFKNIQKKTYVLDISNEQSIFYESKKMNVDAKDNNNLVAAFVGNGVYYHNAKSSKTLNKKNSLGEDFIIVSESKYTWKLTREKKKNRDYNCFKATTVHKFTNRIGQIKTKKITAWYNPEIPINIGIKNYHGLPGVIISLDEGDLTYECVKIEVYPKENLFITKPTKGRIISEEDYNNILKTDFTKKFGIKNR